MTGVSVHEVGVPAGPPVVLLHGLTDDGTNWPDAVERWRDRYRLLAVDLRGHGRSPRFDAEGLADLDGTLTADVLALLTDVGRPAVLVGHSLGGRVALLATLQRPDAVLGLVLEDPALRDAPPEADQAAFAVAQQQGLDDLAADSAGVLARMRRETRWSDAELEAWAASKARVDRGMIAALRFGPLPRAEALNALTKPTLVLSDADGGLQIPEGEVTNPLVRVERLDDVGHCIRRDDPQLYHGLVDPFLVRVTGAA